MEQDYFFDYEKAQADSSRLFGDLIAIFEAERVRLEQLHQKRVEALKQAQNEKPTLRDWWKRITGG